MNRPNATFFFGLRTSEWFSTRSIRAGKFLQAMSIDAARNGVIAGNYVYNAVVDRQRGVMAILRQPIPGTGNDASVAVCRIDLPTVEQLWGGATDVSSL